MEELTRRVDEEFAEAIGRQPGFVAYEFMDCGDGEIMTLSIFGEGAQAEASRALAEQWTEENLQDLEFSRLETLRGAILVSRAAQDMLEPGHAGAARKFVSVRRYALRTGAVGELMHIVDEMFADQIEAMDGSGLITHSTAAARSCRSACSATRRRRRPPTSWRSSSSAANWAASRSNAPK
jgi:hypothetical protein